MIRKCRGPSQHLSAAKSICTKTALMSCRLIITIMHNTRIVLATAQLGTTQFYQSLPSVISPLLRQLPHLPSRKAEQVTPDFPGSNLDEVVTVLFWSYTAIPDKETAPKRHFRTSCPRSGNTTQQPLGMSSTCHEHFPMGFQKIRYSLGSQLLIGNLYPTLISQ